MSRIVPGGLRDIGLAAWAGSRIAGRVLGTEPPAFITVLGRGRRQFWGWLMFAGSLMPGGRLARQETEAVILRVAALTSSQYEREHHVRLGLRAGLSETQVSDALLEGAAASPWTPRERAILNATDHLVQTRDLDDAAWAQLRRHLSEHEALELVQLVGNYHLLATTLHVLRIPPDPRKS